MTGEVAVEVDIADVIRGFHAVKINVHKAVPALLARLSLKGEVFMKRIDVSPYRTGRLRGSIGAYPKVKPTSIASDMKKSGLPGGTYVGVNYAFAANRYSRKPYFIERTKAHIESIIQRESNLVIKNALRGMSK